MKNDVYKLLLCETDPKKLTSDLIEALATHDKLATVRSAEKLDDLQFSHVAYMASETLLGNQAVSHIEKAAFNEIFLLAAEHGKKSDAIAEFGKVTGQSRTQIYRTRSVWTVFGEKLWNQPSIAMQFTVEALNILSEQWVLAEARDAAIERAAKGERIRIEDAKRLAGPRPKDATTGRANGQGNKTTPKRAWKFETQQAYVKVQGAKSGGIIDAQMIVVALDCALNRARKELADLSNAKSA